MEYEQPQYTMSFDDDTHTVLKGAEQATQDLSKQLLRVLSPAPQVGEMPDTYVRLPAGLVVDDEIVRDAQVQELTGEHEEQLAKARTSSNPAKFLRTLLQCGVVSIGDTPSTTDMLDSLIQGDLDALMLGIRRATFGNDFDVYDVRCPSCGTPNDLHLDLSVIPMKELDSPTDREKLVPLRNGRQALVQFPTGEVQNAIYKEPLSTPEMNSITLATCVVSFVEADGTTRPCRGLTDVKKMGIADRSTLQDYIYNNQPGPRYDQVVATCPSCEGEVPVPLNVGILFRGI